jgi:hypothetical protein
MHSSINGILIKILQSSWVLIATSKMRSILLLNFMSKKNNPSSYKHSPDSPPSSRSPSPGDSSSSRGSSVDGDGFTVVGARMRRHRSEWNSRRDKLHKDLRIMEYSLVLASVMMKELSTPEVSIFIVRSSRAIAISDATAPWKKSSSRPSTAPTTIREAMCKPLSHTATKKIPLSPSQLSGIYHITSISS